MSGSPRPIRIRRRRRALELGHVNGTLWAIGNGLTTGPLVSYLAQDLHATGFALSLQYHNKKDETIYLWRGRLLFEIQDGDTIVRREMLPGESEHITPRTIHRMTALEDSDILEVSTPELDDVVRLEDRYGRMEKK